jgi:hypothetical protein
MFFSHQMIIIMMRRGISSDASEAACKGGWHNERPTYLHLVLTRSHSVHTQDACILVSRFHMLFAYNKAFNTIFAAPLDFRDYEDSSTWAQWRSQQRDRKGGEML